MAKTKLISVSCPKCGKIYRIYRTNLGRKGICKQCGSGFSMIYREANKPKINRNQKIKPVVRSAPPNESQSKVKQVISESVEMPESKTKKNEVSAQKKTVIQEKKQKASNKQDHLKTTKMSAQKKPVVQEKTQESAKPFKPLPKISNNSVAKKDLNILSEQIKLLTTDGMKAFLVEKTKMDNDVTIADLKKFLEREKIVYGIVGDEEFQKFIDNRLNRIKPFLIAKGTEPTEPKHGKIKYYFDTNPLKSIVPNQDENNERVDFKERGEMPYVEKGTLIAERIPGIPGKNGKDVYGKRIDAKKAHHVTLRCGNGALLSEDKRLIHSRISGLPVSTTGRNERIDVLPQYFINGDVNMKTGNIRFNGPVVIKGTVQNGFKVRCASLEAKELFRADIRVGGDTNIQGGVVGSKIVCMGSFKSKFIKGSTIECEDDIVVSNGIVDSKIETRCNCIVENNKILTSEIIAYKDIVTMHLGSKSSPGCHLTIGMDPVLLKNIAHLKKENLELEEELISLKEDLDIESVEDLEDELESVKKKIEDLEPMLSEARSINKNLIQQYKKIIKSENDEKRSKVLKTIKAFSSKIGPAKQELHALTASKRAIAESLEKINKITDKIAQNSSEIQKINRQIQTSDQPSKVLVRGDVFQGTMIQGIGDRMEIFDKQSFVMFEEALVYNENNLPERQIQSHPLEKK